MGLIDILTQYDAKKKAAHAAKTVKHGVRVPPNPFLSFDWEQREPFVREQWGGKRTKGWVRKWCGEDWRLRSGEGWWGA